MNVFGIGLPELIVIALLLLLFFGKNRLPGLFRSIGTSIKEFKNGFSSDDTVTLNAREDASERLKHEQVRSETYEPGPTERR